MKKFIIIFCLILMTMSYTQAGVYTIKKNGTIQNSNGQVQQNINTPNKNNQTVQNHNANISDRIFTKAQSDNPQEDTNKDNSSLKNPFSDRNRLSKADIENLKKNNDIYIKEGIPNINLDNIWKNYGKDPKAYRVKQAVLNKQTNIDDCSITTFSNSSMYAIHCESNWAYSYFYISVDNPTLIKLNYNKMINKNLIISYSYIRNPVTGSWLDADIVIRYPGKAEFIYKKQNEIYTLLGYYIGNTYYNLEGNKELTRTTKKL